MKNKEGVFVRRALVSVEKAERYNQAKQVGVIVLAFEAAFWLTERSLGREITLEPVLIGVGLIAAVCTATITATRFAPFECSFSSGRAFSRLYNS